MSIHSTFFNKPYMAACLCWMQKMDWEDVDWPRGKICFLSIISHSSCEFVWEKRKERQPREEFQWATSQLFPFPTVFPQLGHMPKVPLSLEKHCVKRRCFTSHFLQQGLWIKLDDHEIPDGLTKGIKVNMTYNTRGNWVDGCWFWVILFKRQCHDSAAHPSSTGSEAACYVWAYLSKGKVTCCPTLHGADAQWGLVMQPKNAETPRHYT